ncbi:MAG: hypothetical protein KGL04_05255, partial [Elusimicrobia bacterium]|nr:hypothetical protein [Elusimicrobiota bacterium]
GCRRLFHFSHFVLLKAKFRLNSMLHNKRSGRNVALTRISGWAIVFSMARMEAGRKRKLAFWLILGGICAFSLLFLILGFLSYRSALITMTRRGSATSSASALAPYSSKLGPPIYLPQGWTIERDDKAALIAKSGPGAVFSIYPAGTGMNEKSIRMRFPLISGVLGNILARNCLDASHSSPELQRTLLRSGPVYYYFTSCAGRDGSSVAVLTMAWLDGAGAYTGGTFFRNPTSDVRGLTFALLSGNPAWLSTSRQDAAPSQSAPEPRR